MSDAGLLLAVSLVAGVTASIVFEFMNAFRVKVFYESVEDGQPLLQNLLLAGFLCSIANGLLMTAVLGMPAGITQIAYTMAAFVIGDCIGLLLAWVLARYAFDLLGVRER
jgi:putative flippase GtrA